MNYNTLEKNKKLVIKARKKDIFMLAFCAVFMLLPISVALAFVKDWRAVICLLLFIVFPVIIIKKIINDNRLIKQISFVEDNKKINKTYNVKLCNSSVNWLVDTGPGGRIRHSSSSYFCYGIYLVDKNKKKYYILYDEIKTHTFKDIKRLESRYSCEFTIQCYEGTTIVKTVDNAPFCFEDTYTPVYKPFIKNKR